MSDELKRKRTEQLLYADFAGQAKDPKDMDEYRLWLVEKVLDQSKEIFELEGAQVKKKALGKGLESLIPSGTKIDLDKMPPLPEMFYIDLELGQVKTQVGALPASRDEVAFQLEEMKDQINDKVLRINNWFKWLVEKANNAD